MRTRRYLAVGVLTLACFAGAAAGAAPAGAADPVVASSCAGVVEGSDGQEVVLEPRSVAEPIAAALSPLDPLGILVGPFRTAWNSLPPIPVGMVAAGKTVLSGTQIADAVVDRLRAVPAVAPVVELLIPAVHSALSAACGILAQGSRPDAPGAGKPSPAPPQSGAPGSTPPSPSASERFLWASAQNSTATGTGARFGVPLSGLLPDGAAISSFSAPSAPQPVVRGNDQSAQGVNAQRAAGTANALPRKQEQVPLPMLLAVLVLTPVSVQLVRTWVLRER